MFSKLFLDNFTVTGMVKYKIQLSMCVCCVFVVYVCARMCVCACACQLDIQKKTGGWWNLFVK